MIENRTFDEIAMGDTASLTRTFSQQDIDLFAVISGDVNPAHMDPAHAATDIFHKVIAHGILGAGLVSSVLGTRLPGPGTIYLGQEQGFLRSVSISDTSTATLTITEKNPVKHNLTLNCWCIRVSRTSGIWAPSWSVTRPAESSAP